MFGGLLGFRSRLGEIDLGVSDQFQLDPSLLEDGVPRELWCADIVSRVEFVVALLCHQELGFDVESCARINLMFWWLHTDGSELFGCMGQDENITLRWKMLKARQDQYVIMMSGRR